MAGAGSQSTGWEGTLACRTARLGRGPAGGYRSALAPPGTGYTRAPFLPSTVPSMSQLFVVHSGNPQRRLLAQAVAILRSGGLIVYPTDSCYALGCCIGNKEAMERIRRIRRLGGEHNFTLVCGDLSELGAYAKVDNSAFRLIKTLTPGPYTFILQATREVPRRLQHPRRRTIGLRMPDNRVAARLLEGLGEPLMSSTLILPGDDLPLGEPEAIRDRLQDDVDLVIDGGHCGHRPTTVVDLTGGSPEVLREGLGSLEGLEGDRR